MSDGARCQRRTAKINGRTGWGGRGSRPWYHICAIFCTNPSESAQPTQRGCVVTPRTRRTLPSQNSTSVMSCRRGCYLGADWPAHFYCPTTWLTFASTGHCRGSHGSAQEEKMTARTHTWNQALTFAHHRRKKQEGRSRTTASHFMSKHHLDNHHALHVSVKEKCHNGFNQPPTKTQSSFSTRGFFFFLSLIRGASSSLQTQTCSLPWWRTAHKRWFQLIFCHFWQQITPFPVAFKHIGAKFTLHLQSSVTAVDLVV